MIALRDVETAMPGLLAASRDFFRNYKVPRGGQYNVFGFDGNSTNHNNTLIKDYCV